MFLSIIWFLYLLFGSISLGYLFLRIGVPKIRTLDESYKFGWSALIGGVFALGVGGVSFALYFLTGDGAFFVTLVAAVPVIAVVLHLKKKFGRRRRIRVSVPKEYYRAKRLADMVEVKREATGTVFTSKKMSEKKRAEIRKLLMQKPVETAKPVAAQEKREIKLKAREEKKVEKKVMGKTGKKAGVFARLGNVFKGRKKAGKTGKKEKPQREKFETKKVEEKKPVVKAGKFSEDREKRRVEEKKKVEVDRIFKQMEKVKIGDIFPKPEGKRSEKRVVVTGRPAYVPRRMKRFYRQYPAEKEKTYKVAMPTKNEIAESLFEQFGKGRAVGRQSELENISNALFEQMKLVDDEGRVSRDKRKTVKLAMGEVKRFRAKYHRYPAKEDYDDIAGSIFKQLQDSGEAKEETTGAKIAMPEKKAGGDGAASYRERMLERRRLAKEKKGQKDAGGVEIERRAPGEEVGGVGTAAPLMDESIKDMSVKDLFGEKEGNELKLEDVDISGDDELSLGQLGEEIDNVTKEIETDKNKCPTCGSAADIIFCAGCGTGFCANCAKKVKKIGEQIQYTCPACGKEIKTTAK